MTTVLSTRSLDTFQSSRLAKAGIHLENYDALTIRFLETEIPNTFHHYVFTSKNGVKGFLKNKRPDRKDQRDFTCYCVGEKTRLFLEENDFFVIKTAENAEELGNFLVNSAKKGPFLIFTGNRNRPEIRDKLSRNQIAYTELQVYETHLNSKKFEEDFDCILFFSPSGVRSFTAGNKPQKGLALCIGETTAGEAQHFFSRVVTADKPTADAVVDKLIEIIPALTKS